MTQTLIGIGRLLVQGVSHPCRYHVDINDRRGERGGAGFLIGSLEALSSALTARRCLLRLDDGRSCPVVVTSYHSGNTDAAIRVSGSLTASEGLGHALPTDLH